MMITQKVLGLYILRNSFEIQFLSCQEAKMIDYNLFGVFFDPVVLSVKRKNSVDHLRVKFFNSFLTQLAMHQSFLELLRIDDPLIKQTHRNRQLLQF